MLKISLQKLPESHFGCSFWLLPAGAGRHKPGNPGFEPLLTRKHEVFRKSSLTFKQQFVKMLQDEKKVRKNGSIEHADFDFLTNVKDDKLSKISEHEQEHVTYKLKKLIC